MRCVPVFILFMIFQASARTAEPEETWWSLRPLQKSRVPVFLESNHKPIGNPVDAFVRTKLKEEGLTPAPETDRRTLIRRVSFDLLGLPPTPSEIDAFLKDTSADAYEKLIDRLLASPHYGEWWAQHWMDVVHFAETHGHDQDRVRPNAWPYRDYLIEAFNSDRPYGRFVREQVAGDVLFPTEPQVIPALGMLSAGPWDESSLRDIREDTVDRQVGYYLDRDDMVGTVMSTFNSLTVHCARCHDHKFDPISQDDYYALQAVFAGVGRAERPFETDPVLARKRQELQRKLAALKKPDDKCIEELRGPTLAAEIRSWETTTPRAVNWTILDATQFTSAGGALLKKLDDRSILAGGVKPDRDTYTIAASTDLKDITAIRLELLTDKSLPKHGPGRQDNGNLHLSEFRVSIGPKATPDKQRNIVITDATSDFDQAGWTVRHAIDNQPATAWGIYPEVGKDHQAIFNLKDKVGSEGGTSFRFVLEQQHGGSHLIGRLRLSVTNALPPVTVLKLPDSISQALDVQAEHRSREQKIAIAAYYLKGKLETELAKLPAAKKVYAAAHEFDPDGSHKPVMKPRVVQVLKRGEIGKPLREARPGALSCIAQLSDRFKLDDPDDEGARRSALAQWLTDERNPLTWRSIVNRVWHYHFGRGIVDSPNDFGKMGGMPSHPELLDYLAVDFRDNGQSIKKLHKLIVTSAAYRQSTTFDEANAKKDGDNRFLWRMNRNRLDAESVRDAILLVSERLNRTRGGPSDQQFQMRPGIHVTPVVKYVPFAWERPEGHRRSVYRFIFRTLPDPFVACLDGADSSQLTPARNTSITPLQALALLNNEFVLVHSRALAASLEKMSDDSDKHISAACERIWGRPPTEQEREEMAAYVKSFGLANLCRLLFNSNEFLFVN